MNICLLEVAMFEKCRSSHFQPEGGGVKSLRTGGKGLKILGLVGGGSIPHYKPCLSVSGTLVENGLISYGSQYLLWDYLPGFEQNFISENK